MKGHLRDQFRGLFDHIDKVQWSRECRDLEKQVIHFCLQISGFKVGSVVALFGGLRDEVDLVADVLSVLVKGGLQPALFGLQDSSSGRLEGEMDAYLVDDLSKTKRGRFGVWEPIVSKTSLVHPEEISAVLVPGLFFSETTGARLGRGGGFFDRYLSRAPSSVMRVGVGLEWQLRDGIPLESHDQKMDLLLTNERIVSCGKGRFLGY